MQDGQDVCEWAALYTFYRTCTHQEALFALQFGVEETQW